MEYKREELIALMREMEKQIALCHIRPQLAGAIADELEKDAVVRCEDCKYHNEAPCPMRLSFNWTKDSDFCSYGERKGGDAK